MDVIVKLLKKRKLSKRTEDRLELLIEDLKASGGKPFGRGWPNCGWLEELGSNVCHCHLGKRKNDDVVVWSIDKDKTKIICKLLYIGKRKDAPYK